MRGTVYFVISDWIETVKQKSVKESTYDRLKTSLKLLSRYAISNIKIDDLTADDIQEYLYTLSDDEYSMSTIKKQRDLLRAFLRRAFADGSVTLPLYLNIELPSAARIKKQTNEIVAYDDVEQNKLMRELNRFEDISYGVFILMLECGLRIGEVLALSWDDILWNRRAVKISKTFVRLSTGRMFVQQGAKSKTSNRTIPLSTVAFNTLNTIRNKYGSNSGFIFSKVTDGNSIDNFPITYEHIRYHLHKICNLTGVEYKGCHAFRHTFATNCYYRGCDVKILSKLLGHADVSITYNVYINLYGDALEDMRKVLG